MYGIIFLVLIRDKHVIRVVAWFKRLLFIQFIAIKLLCNNDSGLYGCGFVYCNVFSSVRRWFVEANADLYNNVLLCSISPDTPLNAQIQTPIDCLV